MNQYSEAFWVIWPLLLPGLIMVICLKQEWLKWLKRPVDGGSNLFGNNKTWLGFVVMGGGASITGLILWHLTPTFLSNWTVETNFLTVGLSFGLVGVFYSLGELPNSYVKRRLGVSPGDLPSKFQNGHRLLDLADGLLGAGFIYLIIFGVSLNTLLIAFGAGLVIHRLIDMLMIKMRLKPRESKYKKRGR